MAHRHRLPSAVMCWNLERPLPYPAPPPPRPPFSLAFVVMCSRYRKTVTKTWPTTTSRDRACPDACSTLTCALPMLSRTPGSTWGGFLGRQRKARTRERGRNLSMSRQRLEGEGEGQTGKEALCAGSAGGGGGEAGGEFFLPSL